MKKKIWVLLAVLMMLIYLPGCEKDTREDTTLEITASTDSGIPYFTIATNLPDETILEVEVTKAASTDNGAILAYDKEETVSVKDGKAETGKFSDNGKSLSGTYFVHVSTAYMDEQPSSVQEATGNGENLKGDLVKTNQFLDDAIYVSNLESFTFKYDEDASVGAGEEKAETNEQALSLSNDIPGKIESTIRSRVSSEYTNTDIDEITINEDAGTNTEDDYIALVYLTWNVKNSESTSEEMLDMYSKDLAATLAEKYSSVQEVAVFWEVPYLTENTSKWSFERRGENMYLTDNVLGW